LTTVSYLGKNEPFFCGLECDWENEAVFFDCDQLRKICVPPDYIDDVFCDRSDFCRAEFCDDVILGGDFCFEDACFQGKKTDQPVKRKNATEWEKLSNACVEFGCDGNTGFYLTVMCKTTPGERYMCVNDGCLPVDEWSVRVEIEIESTRVDLVNPEMISSAITTFTGIEVNTSCEIKEEGDVIRIIVKVSSESDGNIVKECVENTDALSNVLDRRVKSARVVVVSRDLESSVLHLDDSNRIYGGFLSIILMFFICITFIQCI